MVRLHVKKGDESQFLYDTTVEARVDDVIQEVTVIYNGRLKISRLCYEIEELAKHGTMLPDNIMGLTDEQVQELKLKDEWGEKCIPSGGWTFNKDAIGRRNGRQPTESMQNVLKKTIEDARAMTSKKLVSQEKLMTLKIVQEALDLLRGAVTIVYPMGLPPHDVIRHELENTEDLEGTQASLEVMDVQMAQLWFSGKELIRGKKIRDFLGPNEKTKVVVKLHKRGSGKPGREPLMSEDERKQMMLHGFQRQEQLKIMDWLTLILTMVVGILGIRYFFFRKLNKLEQLGILHIKPWPIVGNMAPAIFRRGTLTETIERIYRLNEEADYVGLYNFSDPIILIRTPELIKNIAIKNFDYFVDHGVTVDPDMDYLLAKNLVALHGEQWKKVRNVLSPAFTSSKMKSMFHLMSKCGENFVNYLIERSADKPNDIDTKDIFTRYTNDVLATCSFGISVDSMKNPENNFYVMGKKATNLEGFLSVKFFILSSFPKIAKFLNLKFNDASTENFFRTVVKETIDTRDREGITRPDMIQLMMETRGNKPGEGPELTIQDMTAQAFIFFFGAFESSSSTMCFAAYEIAVNEDVQKKLQVEVDEVMNKSKGELTYEAINEMQYLDAVINEALRLYPIGSFLDRVCVKRFELPPALPGDKPLTIEPGQNIWLPTFSVQRDAKYFPDPTKYDPDRFMDSRKRDIDASTYFPFGLGPRMCIGSRFALLEIKVVLFHLLSKFHLKPSSKTLVPLELSTTSFATTAKGGFWLQLEPRNTNTGKVM